MDNMDGPLSRQIAVSMLHHLASHAISRYFRFNFSACITSPPLLSRRFRVIAMATLDLTGKPRVVI